MKTAVIFLVLSTVLMSTGCGGKKADLPEPKIGGKGTTYKFDWKEIDGQTVYYFDEKEAGKGDAGFEVVISKVSALPADSVIYELGPYTEGRPRKVPFDQRRLYELMVKRNIGRIWALAE